MAVRFHLKTPDIYDIISFHISQLDTASSQALSRHLLRWKEMGFRRQTPIADGELRENKHTVGGGRVPVQQANGDKTI